MIVFFYITWQDPTAYATVVEATRQWKAGEKRTCERQCSDYVGDQACCDGIFMPAFTFRNAYALPGDSATVSRLAILPEPNGSVAWQVNVGGVFYQPMKLTHFPFDSYDLAVQLEFQDTSGPSHPGLRLVPSSAGSTLAAKGTGDAVSQFSIDGLELLVSTGPPTTSAYFEARSTQQSAPGDPLGLTTTQAPLLRGVQPGPVSRLVARNVTQAIVKVRISRFWGWTCMNSVLPVLLLGMLCFMVFSLEPSDIASRVGVCVTLFLAMAAVQFVLTDAQPASSYIMPTQQATLATYFLLALIALESIVVYRIEMRQERALKRQVLVNAREEFAQEQAQAQEKGAGLEHSPEGAAEAGMEGQGGDRLPTATAASPAGALCGSLLRKRRTGCGASVADWAGRCFGAPANAVTAAAAAAVRPDALRRWETHLRTPQYDAYVAWRVDRIALITLAFAYVLAIVLIFTLQSGYVDLF